MGASTKLSEVCASAALARTPSACLTTDRRASGWPTHPMVPIYSLITEPGSLECSKPWLSLVRSGSAEDGQNSTHLQALSLSGRGYLTLP